MAQLLVNTETRNVHKPDCHWIAGCANAGVLKLEGPDSNYVTTDIDIARKLVGGTFTNHICSYCTPSVS